MRTSLFLALVAAMCFAGSVRADKPGPPSSYAVESANKKFVFVMLAPKTEAFGGHKTSGLYKNDGSTDPLWTVDWYSRSAAVANDGVHVVRFAGPILYEERLNPDRSKRVVTEKDLKKEALSIFAKGKLVKEFSIGDFINDPKQVHKTVTFIRWRKESRIIDAKNQLEVVAHNGTRVLIDLPTGKVIEKQ